MDDEPRVFSIPPGSCRECQCCFKRLSVWPLEPYAPFRCPHCSAWMQWVDIDPVEYERGYCLRCLGCGQMRHGDIRAPVPIFGHCCVCKKDAPQTFDGKFDRRKASFGIAIRAMPDGSMGVITEEPTGKYHVARTSADGADWRIVEINKRMEESLKWVKMREMIRKKELERELAKKEGLNVSGGKQ